MLKSINEKKGNFKEKFLDDKNEENEIKENNISTEKLLENNEKGMFIGSCTKFLLDSNANITHIYVQDLSGKIPNFY